MWWSILMAGAMAAGPVDHVWADWAGVLDGAVAEDGTVDYAMLRSRRDAITSVMERLAEADPEGWMPEQRLAAWINAYNVFTISLVVDRPGLSSIRSIDLGVVFWTRGFTLAGERWTLAGLENQRVRAEGDARIHAAINCASASCPPLSAVPYRAATLDAQLDAAARRWCETTAWRQEGDRVHVSRIFSWFARDFASYADPTVPGATAAQSAAIGFCRAFGHAPAPGSFTQVTLDGYDWSLNGTWGPDAE